MEQLPLIDTSEYSSHPDGWCADDWKTPTPVARYMASLTRPNDSVLEPAAGNGQIVTELLRLGRSVVAIELSESRYQRLAAIDAPYDQLFIHKNKNFLGYSTPRMFDSVVANPPFSLGMEFLKHALSLLYKDSPDARCIFLLPSTFFQTKERGNLFMDLNCRIYQRHSIVGRVSFLKNGVPASDRQCDDCIYDIRPGREGSSMPEVLINPWRLL